MILTKEQQESMLSEYEKTHTIQECNSYVDGIIAIVDLINRVSKENNKNFSCRLYNKRTDCDWHKKDNNACEKCGYKYYF